jgi:hypothetical protein
MGKDYEDMDSEEMLFELYWLRAEVERLRDEMAAQKSSAVPARN